MVQITISGHPGSGTSTLVKGLCEHFNWTSLNGGDIFRGEAKTRGMTLADFGEMCKEDLSVDKQLDEILMQRMQEENGADVIESRLSGWWAYRLNLDCIRLWLHVDDEQRAKRVVAREGSDYQTAYSENATRMKVDAERFDILYGIQPADEEPYTHIVDASQLDVQQVLESVIQILNEREE